MKKTNIILLFILFLVLGAGFLFVKYNAGEKSADAKFNVENARHYEAKGWKEMAKVISRINPPSFPGNTVNLTQFGGKGDGKTDNRSFFEKAISVLSEKGGGKLIVSPGTYWVDGPIVMKSNIHIEIQKNATILFSSNPDSYTPLVKQRWEGTVCYNYSPFISGHNLTNIALTGEGTIDGAAGDWSRSWKSKQDADKKVLRQMGHETIPDEHRVFGNGFLDLDSDGKDDGYGDGKPHYLRPSLIEFYECENILLEGLKITGSPFWTVHPVFCKNITGRNLNITGDGSPNDDGFDPESCEDVLIEGCNIDTRDDAISVKAGRDQDAWNRPPSRNIIVRNNTLTSGANAFCIGSEMSGGVENVFVENNTIIKAGNALKFKCNLDRGGYVRNIFIRNNTVSYCKQSLVDFTTDYHGYRGGNYPVDFRDIYISGVTCNDVGRTAIELVGVEKKPIQRIYLNNIHVKKANSKLELKYSQDIVFHKVTVNGELVVL